MQNRIEKLIEAEICKILAGPTESQPSTRDEQHPFWAVGKAYFIRTATYHQTGLLVAFTDTELVFKRAAWIADTGRFSPAMKTCDFREVEPWPIENVVLVNRAAIIDATQIPEERLPKELK